MIRDDSLPGYSELLDWPTQPAQPFVISDFGRRRDGGPRGGTYFVDLKDSNGIVFPFFFDRFLGRLCFGSKCETGEDAAFLRKHSKIQVEAFRIIAALASGSGEHQEVSECLAHAETWT